MKRISLLLVALAWTSAPQAVECPCDHSMPVTLESRGCSLCKEAEKQTAEFFWLKDKSPSKPNRSLMLPRKHSKGPQDLPDLSAEERARFWKTSIARAAELWPDTWALAYNADTVRTQCHLHVHIGKLMEGIDDSGGRLIAAPEDLPLPQPGKGIWLHPVAGGYHVHTDREIPEPVLVR